jgi:multicomponent Na+:H+ antiporter subunit D
MTYALILAPLLALLVMNLVPLKMRRDSAFIITLLIVLGYMIAACLHLVGIWQYSFFIQLEQTLRFTLHLTNVGAVMLLAASLVSFAALCVGRATLRHHNDEFNFYSLMLIALVGMSGIAMASGLFQLYIFIEITALATFIMICLRKERAAYEGVWKYLIMSVVASVLMLTAVGLCLVFSPSSTFTVLQQSVSLAGGSFLPRAMIAFFLCGLFIKSGLVPFHGWLPDAYQSAPPPVAVLLAGIITKATGVFALVRFLMEVAGYNPAVSELLLFLGALSIVVGALAALGQTSVKRLLAYSSISQVGYIVLALGAGTRLGWIAAIFHFFNHALFKAQLFTNAAALEERLGGDDLDKISGVGGKMPVTAATLLIGSLSTAGIPPLAGFWSKLLIIAALWLSGYHFYAVIAVLASVLTLAYFLVLQRRLFFGKTAPELGTASEAGGLLLFPAIALSGLTVLIGLVWPLFWEVLIK